MSRWNGPLIDQQPTPGDVAADQRAAAIAKVSGRLERAARALYATLSPKQARTVPTSAQCPQNGRESTPSRRDDRKTANIRFGPGPPAPPEAAAHATHNRINHYLEAAEGIALGTLLALIILTTGGIL